MRPPLALALACALGAACATARTEPAPADGAAANGAAAGGTAGGAAGPDSVSVRAVLERPDLVGRTVRVAGRCLGYAAARAAGPPPRTRSDWQLEGDGAAVWVAGPRPAGCATDGSSRVDVIDARVAQDTVPSLTGGTGTARRYLVR